MTRLEHQLWPTLRRYWHPVAYAAEVGEAPHPVRLLGERLVLARLGGRMACYRDLCVHRGTALSLGRVEGEELVCAYHGWRYREDGRCVHIPALPADRPIPARAQIERFACAERYGLIWACLSDDPVVGVPEYPEFGAAGYDAVFVPPQDWRASAARATENSVDAAHFPWLHEGILGSREHPEVPVFPIEQVGEELRYRWDDLPNAMHPVGHTRVYRLQRPFSIHQRKERAESDEVEAVLIAACPRDEAECTVYLVICRNFPLTEEELAERMATDILILEQDRPVVESQRPAELPLDLSAELHLRGPDAVAVAYRRFMADIGVDIDAVPAERVSEPRIDDGEVETILADLVRIASPNPPGDEAAVVEHVVTLLDAAGIVWSTDEVAPRRPNLHVHLGPREAPALVLNGHTDTMPPGDGWSSDPWQPVVRNGRMSGLGACDMKAGLAAMLGAALALRRAGAPCTGGLRLDLVVDEEATAAGTRHAAAGQPAPRAAVIVEPTSLALVPVGNGQINVAYTVRGAAAHGSTPALGANAVAAAARAIVALEQWVQTRTPASHALIGDETLSIGTIAGGMKTSVVPDRCRFSVDLRVTPGRDPEGVAAEADAVVDGALGGLPGISWRREVEIRVPPFGLPAEAPLCAAVERAHRAVTGSGPAVTGLRATTDAAWYAERSVPTVVYGAGDLAQAHRPDEWVPLAEVATLSQVLLALALDLCA